MSSPQPEEDDAYSVNITVHGGKKDAVEASMKEHLVGSEDVEMYQTWVNVAALRRIGLIFQGGVEASGAITDLLCLITAIGAILMIFVFWQVVVFFAVILVLTLLSGGSAIKYLRGTYITAEAAKVDSNRLEQFVMEQLKSGNFVGISDPEKAVQQGPVTKRSNRAKFAFTTGIYISLGVATVFLIEEVLYWWFFNTWWPPLEFLMTLGIGFLIGVIAMDLGVILRWRAAKSLR
ncbi:MAG: hypothetical protein ACXABV_04885 [Candidatus Thorarchaeota archaeon]